MENYAITEDLLAIVSDLEERVAKLESSSKTTLLIGDVAAMTGLSRSHIYKLTCTNQIPYYKPNGKHLYFDRSEIEAWLKRGKGMTNDEARQIATKYNVKRSMGV